MEPYPTFLFFEADGFECKLKVTPLLQLSLLWSALLQDEEEASGLLKWFLVISVILLLFDSPQIISLDG